jgi:hypothetical protein
MPLAQSSAMALMQGAYMSGRGYARASCIDRHPNFPTTYYLSSSPNAVSSCMCSSAHSGCWPKADVTQLAAE